MAFKINAPFISCKTKINNTLIDNAKDLNTVMPMYNLIEYSKSYSKTTGSLWNYYRDEQNSCAIGNINYSINGSKSVDYKTSITGRFEDNNTERNVEIAVPLKSLSNFWRTPDILLINCEINLILTWSENCVLSSNATRNADPDANPAIAAINNPTGATFKITNTKLYIPVVTSSTEDELTEQLKTGFKRTIRWKKYRWEMSKQTETNNLSYLIDPTFSRVNRLFVFSF